MYDSVYLVRSNSEVFILLNPQFFTLFPLHLRAFLFPSNPVQLSVYPE